MAVKGDDNEKGCKTKVNPYIINSIVYVFQKTKSNSL